MLTASTYKVLPGQPAGIDLTTVYEGKPPALHTKAIYSLRGDVLTYCIAPPGQPRPSAFATTKGDGLTLVVLRRLPPGSE
jgi:hypothetical protein